MAITAIPIWKEAPFIRLLIPFIAGIIMQWYFELPHMLNWIMGITCLPLIFLFGYLRAFTQFRYYWATGIFINLALFNCGALVTYYSDARHQPNRTTYLLEHNSAVIVTLDEPLSEKTNSFKANAVVNYVCKADSLVKSNEHIIIYFEKDSSLGKIHFNSRLAFSKPLMAIRSTGNPGAFDYQQYCALQGVYYQAYLKKDDYNILPAGKEQLFRRLLFSSRESIVNIMRKFIPGEKEAGMAEALLIGYRDDLDKNLVQLYSNTGVVHIIAISGLHVGLIYGVLNLLLYPLGRKHGMRWLKALFAISGLWMFGFLAGGSASVLRSALMFTFIVTGENIGRKTGIYNSLAASAFLLLCYNPFWLWDAGFLLSYIAVLSIVIFMKGLYNLFFVQNKLLDLIWKMTTISVAAQILTTPISIFLFHQFANYFLITNLVAVPLSSLILIAELVLCATSWFPLIAKTSAWVVYQLIMLMNRFVEHISDMPFSTWDQLQLSAIQVVAIYVTIAATAYWLFRKNRPAFIIALISLVCLSVIRSVVIVRALDQRRLIVYNAPRHQAIDMISASDFCFVGDTEMQENLPLRDLYLKPSHNFYRVNKSPRLRVSMEGTSLYFCNKRILIIDKPLSAVADSSMCVADIVILSGNPNIYIEQILGLVSCKQFVFDSSNPLSKIKRWESDCKKYGVTGYSVPENGAFILNMN